MARDSGALTPNESCNWLPCDGNDSSLLHAVNVVHAANRREKNVPFANLVAVFSGITPPPKNLYVICS